MLFRLIEFAVPLLLAVGLFLLVGLFAPFPVVVGVAAIVGLVLWFLWRKLLFFFLVLRGVNEALDENHVLVSMVLLHRKPLALDRETVERRVKEALGHEELGVFGPLELPGEGNNIGFPVSKGAYRFSVSVVNAPYHGSEEPKMREPRSEPEAEAITRYREHVSWIAIDNHTGPEEDVPTDDAAVFPFLGRIAAAFAEHDAPLALLTPTYQELAAWKPELAEVLRGPEPLRVFGENLTRVCPPIVQASTDNEALNAAMEEARRRFPEFIAAFEKRDPAAENDGFYVKCRFEEDDDVEHMWIEVQQIGEDTLRGKLLNEPGRLERWKLDDIVEMKQETIGDWMIRRGENTEGNFTEAILRGQG